MIRARRNMSSEQEDASLWLEIERGEGHESAGEWRARFPFWAHDPVRDALLQTAADLGGRFTVSRMVEELGNVAGARGHALRDATLEKRTRSGIDDLVARGYLEKTDYIASRVGLQAVGQGGREAAVYRISDIGREAALAARVLGGERRLVEDLDDVIAREVAAYEDKPARRRGRPGAPVYVAPHAAKRKTCGLCSIKHRLKEHRGHAVPSHELAPVGAEEAPHALAEVNPMSKRKKKTTQAKSAKRAKRRKVTTTSTKVTTTTKTTTRNPRGKRRAPRVPRPLLLRGKAKRIAAWALKTFGSVPRAREAIKSFAQSEGTKLSADRRHTLERARKLLRRFGERLQQNPATLLATLLPAVAVNPTPTKKARPKRLSAIARFLRDKPVGFRCLFRELPEWVQHDKRSRKAALRAVRFDRSKLGDVPVEVVDDPRAPEPTALQAVGALEVVVYRKGAKKRGAKGRHGTYYHVSGDHGRGRRKSTPPALGFDPVTKSEVVVGRRGTRRGFSTDRGLLG